MIAQIEGRRSSIDAAQLEAILSGVQAELQELFAERSRLENQRTELESRIAKREHYAHATEELLSEERPTVAHGPIKPPLTILATTEQLRPVKPLPPNTEAALIGYPRSGYGAVTKAVERLLAVRTQGWTARTMAEILARTGFVVADSHEAAVRSALKNMRKQRKVTHNIETRRYHLNSKAQA